MEDFIYELEKTFGWDPIPEDFVEVDYDDPAFLEDYEEWEPTDEERAEMLADYWDDYREDEGMPNLWDADAEQSKYDDW